MFSPVVVTTGRWDGWVSIVGAHRQRHRRQVNEFRGAAGNRG